MAIKQENTKQDESNEVEIDEMDSDIEEQEADADEPEDDEDDNVDDQEEAEDDEDSESSESDDSEDSEDDEEETVITFEDEPIQKKTEDNSTIRQLRKRIRELEKKTRSTQPQDQQEQNIVRKPFPDIADFDYDKDRYKQATKAWYDEDKRISQIEEKKRSEEEKIQLEIKERSQLYTSGKAELKVKDFDDSEAVVERDLSTEQQLFLLEAADDPSLFVYWLGKNKEHRERLSKINNPRQFAAAVAKLETKLKVTKPENKKPKVKPERIPQGASGSPDSKQKMYEKLLEQGMRAGDISKATEYRRKHNL